MKKNRVIIIGLLLVSLLSDIIEEIIEKYFLMNYALSEGHEREEAW